MKIKYLRHPSPSFGFTVRGAPPDCIHQKQPALYSIGPVRHSALSLPDISPPEPFAYSALYAVPSVRITMPYPAPHPFVFKS